MDYRCSAIKASFTLLLLGLAACQPTAPQGSIEPPDILRWAKPDANVLTILSTEPNECLTSNLKASNVTTTTQLHQQNIALGRMAFRSPFLLGGQAARRGLTCQSCHTQGQRNENFFVIGLSDEPGTADVTSFHFSDELGDESFNPALIPSLSDDVRGIDYDQNNDELEKFVTRLITKEFTGPTPLPEVKTALLAYLRDLDDSACQSSQLQGAALLRYKLTGISETFDILLNNSFKPDTQNFLTNALRAELGRLHLRYPNTQRIQKELVAISQGLKLREAPLTRENLASAQQRWDDLLPRMETAYNRSLFHEGAITDWADAALNR